jgi:hypothetical protein
VPEDAALFFVGDRPSSGDDRCAEPVGVGEGLGVGVALVEVMDLERPGCRVAATCGGGGGSGGRKRC